MSIVFKNTRRGMSITAKGADANALFLAMTKKEDSEGDDRHRYYPDKQFVHVPRGSRKAHPGAVMRLKVKQDTYFPETLFLCTAVDDGVVRARSHFGGPELGPVLLWPRGDDDFEVIGYVDQEVSHE